MKPTPIKRHPAIVSFSRDHHFGLLLAWKIRNGLSKSVSPERISNYALYIFDEDIRKHFEEEEQLLFNHLSPDDSMRKTAEASHQTIYKLIESLRVSKNDVTILNQLADELDGHIRFEEREVFNKIQGLMNDQELQELEGRVSNDSRAIDDKWEDVFWNVEDANSGL